MIGAVTAIMFFISVVLHELSHSWWRGTSDLVQSITLFIFGACLVSAGTGERNAADSDRCCGAGGQLAARRRCSGSSSPRSARWRPPRTADYLA